MRLARYQRIIHTRLPVRNVRQPCGQRLHFARDPAEVPTCLNYAPSRKSFCAPSLFSCQRRFIPGMFRGSSLTLFHRDERATHFSQDQPVAMPLDMEVKIYEAKKIERCVAEKCKKRPLTISPAFQSRTLRENAASQVFEFYTLWHTCLPRLGTPHGPVDAAVNLQSHRDMNITKRYMHRQAQNNSSSYQSITIGNELAYRRKH